MSDLCSSCCTNSIGRSSNMNWLRRVMMGRYARMDQLNIALFVVYLVLMLTRTILSFIFRSGDFIMSFRLGRPIVGVVYSVLFGLQAAVIVCFFLRILSRNINKRVAENQRFVSWWGGVKDAFSFGSQKRQARKEGKLLLKCPTCKKKIRVPLGHGKIEITCPNCKAKFIRKT